MANKTVGDLFATLQATTTAVTALQSALVPLVDGLEGFTDGLEGSIGITSDSAATAGGTGTVISNLRRLTTDLDAIKTTLGTISGNVDGLEGFTDGIEGLITSLNGFVDGLEGSIGATNATAVTDPTATATLLAVLKGILKVLSQDGIKRITDGVVITGKKASSSDVLVMQGQTAPYTPTDFTPTDGNSVFTFAIMGMASSKVVVFEIAPTYSSAGYTVASCVNLKDFSIATQTGDGTDTAPSIWQVEVPVGYKFRPRLVSANSLVTIIGRASIQ